MRNDVRFRILTAAAALVVGLGLAGYAPRAPQQEPCRPSTTHGIPPRASPQAARRRSSRRVQAPGGDLRGEPLLRQPLRHLGRRARPARGRPCRRDPGQAHPGRTGRRRVHLPAAGRRQPRLAGPAVEHLSGPGPRHRREPLRATTSSTSTTTSPRRTGPVRSRRASAPANGVLKDSPDDDPGGCTRDLVHRFYQEQYQIDGGKQDRYTTGSDAVGLTQGVYETQQLPIYRYLHSKGAPKYVIADHFFQGAVRWLVPQPPVADRRPGAARHRPARRRRPRPRDRTQLGARRERDGPNTYPQYHPVGPVLDGELTAGVPGRRQRRGGRVRQLRCQHGAAGAGAPQRDRSPDPADRRHGVPEHRRPDVRGGDQLGLVLRRLGRRGGRARPVALFQFHHQPFNYFADYAPGQARPRAPQGRGGVQGRGTERDAAQGVVRQAVRRGERAPGLRERAERFGPPGRPAAGHHRRGLAPATRWWWSPTTSSAASGTTCPHPAPADRRRHDAWGPGTRIPALIVSRSLSTPAWTTRSTTRPRSWPPSSAASGWHRWRPATRS